MRIKLIGSVLEQLYRDDFINSKNQLLTNPYIRSFLEDSVEKIKSIYVLHCGTTWAIYEEPVDGDFYSYELLVNSEIVFKFELSISNNSIHNIQRMSFTDYVKASNKTKKVQIRLAVLLDLIEKDN